MTTRTPSFVHLLVQVLIVLMGVLLGFLVGFYTALAMVVAKAQVGYYIFSLHDLAEIRLETVTIFIGMVAGGVLAYRMPRRLLRAFLRGLVGVIGGALVGMLGGMLFGDSDEALWVGGIVVSALALLVAMALALRVFKLSRALTRNDLVAASIVIGAILIALVVGLREPAVVTIPEQEPEPLPAAAEVDEVVFIVGDAGATLENGSPLLKALQHDIEQWSATLARDSAVSVVFAGDLVYPVGVRDRTHPAFPQDSTRLWNQIALLGGPAARQHGSLGLFIPGNHDWGNVGDKNGIERIHNLEAQLETARAQDHATYLVPEDGGPGPVIRDLRDNVRFVILDTHWFLRTRSPQERQAFLDRLGEALNTAGDRHVIIVSHHPYRSAGPHGVIIPGVRSWGLEYLLRRSGSIVQDLNAPVYEELLQGMNHLFATADRPPLVFAGGHDHSLQVIEQEAETEPAFMLVSGSGSKVSSIGTLPGMHYGAERPGYMFMTFRKSGAVDLFVVAGERDLLTCTAASKEPQQTCMTIGENAFDIVYGRTLAAAPDRPLLTDSTAAENPEATAPKAPDTVADVTAEPLIEPFSTARSTAWWTRSVLPLSSPIADPEADEDMDVPPPAVPARVLYFQPDSVTTTAGASYLAGPLHRLMLGSLNRHLWDIPIRLPVLNLDTLGGGGFTIEKLTGGMQTVGFRLQGQNGVTYQFRNIVKIGTRGLDGDLQKETVGKVLEDQLAAQFPLGAMVVAELLQAVDVMVAVPRPVVMPNDERLGDYRPYFAGRVGWIEVRPDEREDNQPGFAGSRNVEGGSDIYEVLREDPTSFVDTQKYLRARLIDFLVGDWDRHSDNWRWARFDDEGRTRWEPIPRDRDWAFTRTGGMASNVTPLFFPRYVGFSAEMPPMDRLAASGYRIDHRALAGVPREAFVAEARWVQTILSDSTLAAALAVMPPAYRHTEGDRLLRELQARRALLVEMADAFYDLLAQTVHIHGYDGVTDTVRLELVDDTHIHVRAWTEGRETTPYFDEILDTALTRELRLYLDPDADRVEHPDNLPIQITRVDPDVPDDEARDY